MIVLIDSGNTRLKVALLDGPPFVGGQRVATQAFGNSDADALAGWLKGLPAAPTLALGTNVAGSVRAAAIEAALAEHGCQMRWVKSQAQVLGLKSRYSQPGQLGADRWVSMLGVLSRMPEPRQAFLLACFGTATTVDTVSADGDFDGGLILPGPELMRKSLAAGTADLPLAHGTRHDFPTDTHQAISSGVAAAQAGAVLRQWLAGVRRYWDKPVAVYVAGGGWGEVAAETTRLLEDTAKGMGRLPPEVRVIENPVLDGLAYLAENTDMGAK
jgi:type III pantothenate kinase